VPRSVSFEGTKLVIVSFAHVHALNKHTLDKDKQTQARKNTNSNAVTAPRRESDIDRVL